jgi:dephospho-CoA kinase
MVGTQPLRIGLTGGIAAGKSVVAARLAELGATLVDHDRLARDVVAAGTDGLRAVVDAFGHEVLRPDGALDRAALGSVVFADAAARARLEAILHPRIRAAARAEEDAAVASGAQVVVHDIPLLVESGQSASFDLLVVVDAPVAVRLARLVDGRGLPPVEAERRVAAQADDEARRAVADVVLDGSGPVESLRAQVDRLWSRVGAGAAGADR